MRFRLSTLILVPAVMAAAALAINPAMAETARVKVPFSFTVAGKTLPAGVYSVEWSTPGNFVSLQGKDASQTFTWVANPSATKGDHVVLRFDEQGQTHALQSIQYRELETSRLDKTKKNESISTGIGQGR